MTHTDAYGNVWFSEDDLLDALYRGHAIDLCLAIPSEDVSNYNKYNKVYGTPHKGLMTTFDDSQPVEDFHRSRQVWIMPDKYREIDLPNWFSTKISTPEEQHRVDEELALYTARDLLDLLRLMIYLTTTMRENNVVWGVGRGSSVASYCLYLIGVHRINSLKYNLDIKEFLK